MEVEVETYLKRKIEDFYKAEEKVNSLMAQIKKSADKVIVGKAIWKLMALPAILFGRAVIPTCESLIEGLQRLEIEYGDIYWI